VEESGPPGVVEEPGLVPLRGRGGGARARGGVKGQGEKGELGDFSGQETVTGLLGTRSRCCSKAQGKLVSSQGKKLQERSTGRQLLVLVEMDGSRWFRFRVLND